MFGCFPAGGKIYARPFTNGSMTPDSSASGSADLPPSGSSSQHFSFSGDADVPDIRFQIVNTDQSEVLLVRTLQDGIVASCDHVFTLRGNGLASGAYICRLETPDGVQTQRITLVK